VPCAGTSNLMPMVSMLAAQNVEVVTLLGGNGHARGESKRLVDRVMGGDDRRTLFVADFLPHAGAGIEDIFPRHEYLEAVRHAYPDVELDFQAEEEELTGIVNQVDALFRRKGLGEFEKWRPAAVLRDRLLEEPERAGREAVEVISKINETLNRLLA